MDEATRKAAFAEHARGQQRAWSRLTYRQRLDWLWQAKLFAARALKTLTRQQRNDIVEHVQLRLNTDDGSLIRKFKARCP